MTTARTTTIASRSRAHVPGPLLTFGVVAVTVVVWQVLVVAFNVPSFILPSPIEIVTGADWGVVAVAAGVTALSTLAGFAVGNLVGLLLALLISSSRTISDIVYPGAIVVRSIPVVALAPFITLAFGRGGGATVIVAAMIVFFPTLVNVLLGLRSVSADSVELMHVLNASTVTTYVRLRIPASLPSFFSALRISAPNAVLGVMTAEWIIGGNGLGHLIITSWLALDMATMWAAVVVSAIVAAALFTLVAISERFFIGWAVRT